MEHAEGSLFLKHYEWVALAAQQAAEKSIKAIYQDLGAITCGHVIARLISELPKDLKPQPDFIDDTKIFDRHYIPARYPNGLISGTPRENYTKKDAKEAIRVAKRIVTFSEDCLSGIEKENQRVDN